MSKRTLHPHHASNLMERPVVGSSLSIALEYAFVVSMDDARSDDEPMLVHDRLKGTNDTVFLRYRTPLGIFDPAWVDGLRHALDDLCEHAAAVVRLGDELRDVVLLRDEEERLEGLIVIAPKDASRGREEQPLVQQLHDGVGGLVLASAEPCSSIVTVAVQPYHGKVHRGVNGIQGDEEVRRLERVLLGVRR